MPERAQYNYTNSYFQSQNQRKPPNFQLLISYLMKVWPYHFSFCFDSSTTISSMAFRYRHFKKLINKPVTLDPLDLFDIQGNSPYYGTA